MARLGFPMNALLDIQRRRLSINPNSVPKGERIDFEVAYGRILLSTNLGRLAVDSGTDTLILFGDSTSADKVEMRTAVGTGVASRVAPQKVMLPGIRIQTTATFIVPRPQNTVEDGLLPASVLKALYVKNTEKYLIVAAQ